MPTLFILSLAATTCMASTLISQDVELDDVQDNSPDDLPGVQDDVSDMPDKRRQMVNPLLSQLDVGLDISAENCRTREQKNSKTFKQICGLMALYEKARDQDRTKNMQVNNMIDIPSPLCRIISTIWHVVIDYAENENAGGFLKFRQGSWTGRRNKRYGFATAVLVYFRVLLQECDNQYDPYAETDDSHPLAKFAKDVEELTAPKKKTGVVSMVLQHLKTKFKDKLKNTFKR
eukprot:GEMP01059921.1.p1 GENE.GEMP01059921.1~~GEMP01059921.1.p1  ORF type:complete len:232 (+),score=28.31 GEMP01059921.1:282-977(+)